MAGTSPAMTTIDSVRMGTALVSRIRSSRDCSAGIFANFGFKRDTRITGLLVSLRFGSPLRSPLRTPANFQTATLDSATPIPTNVGARRQTGPSGI
jgi:hypothetical protein